MGHRKTVLLLPLLALVLVPSLRAQPSNDDCPGALPIVLGVQGPFDNSNATLSSPSWPIGPVHRDVWFRHDPRASGRMRFRVVQASFFHAIEVLQGSCGTLTSLGTGTNLTSHAEVEVLATPGAPLWVRVAGLPPEYGTFSLEVSALIDGADACANALPLALGWQGTYSTAQATTSQPPWSTPFPVGNDVWFRFVSPCEGILEIDACSATFDSVIEVFEGTCGALRLVGWEDDGCGIGSLATHMNLFVRSGSVYLLRVGGMAGATGRFDLELAMLGGGCHARRSTACGGLTIGVSGFPAPGERLSYDLGQVSGTPFVVLGTPANFPVCSGTSCVIGVLPIVTLAGSQASGLVPNDPALSGATFTVQGIDLGTTVPGGCSAGAFLPVPLSLSDAFDTRLR
ncbi:MAG: hypothetical protein H6833_10150 [Planctomycetes bacterium]|nr:hypothetical protein [Planctomycetota bacterium]